MKSYLITLKTSNKFVTEITKPKYSMIFSGWRGVFPKKTS